MFLFPSRMTYRLTTPSGSYIFKAGYKPSSQAQIRTEVQVTIQPTSTPHIGTLCCLGLTFMIAHLLVDEGLHVSVACNLWGRAKGEQMEINGVAY